MLYSAIAFLQESCAVKPHSLSTNYHFSMAGYPQLTQFSADEGGSTVPSSCFHSTMLQQTDILSRWACLPSWDISLLFSRRFFDQSIQLKKKLLIRKLLSSTFFHGTNVVALLDHLSLVSELHMPWSEILSYPQQD